MPAPRHFDALSRRLASAEWTNNWKRPLWNLKTGFLLRQFDGFLSPGQRVNDYLRWYRVAEHRIFRVPHAVDNEMFAAAAAPFQQREARAAARERLGIARDAFVPLFVSKLVTSKRPADIVRAAARLERGASVVFVGSGALEGELRTLAAELGVDLKLIGFLNQTELGEAYAIADCLVLPRTTRKRGVWSSTRRSPPVCPASSAMPLAAPPT